MPVGILLRRSFKTRNKRKTIDESPTIFRIGTTKPNKAVILSRSSVSESRSQDDIEACRYSGYWAYNKDDELRRSTGSIYGAIDSPTKTISPIGMHVRSNSDTGEINFAQLKTSYDNSITEPRSPTGESFFAIVQRFEQNIKNESKGPIVRKGGAVQVDGSTFIENLREYHNHGMSSGSPTIEKKTPILRRKNSLRSNTTSFFRIKKTYENKDDPESIESTPTRKYLAHYDCQSLSVDYNEQAQLRARFGDGMKRKNTRSGASAASSKITAAQRADQAAGSNSSLDNTEEVADYGDNKSNELVQNCNYFRNELGGEDDMDPQISLTRDNTSFQNPYDSSTPSKTPNGTVKTLKRRSTLDILLTAYDSARRGNLLSGTGVTILDNSKPESGSLYLGEGDSWSDDEGKIVFEHADHGAYFYRNFFVGQEHLTYLGSDEKLGPIAISLKREKLDENTSLVKNDTEIQGTQYQYRIIIRTSHLLTLRGCILEEAIPSTSRHGTARALPAKDILEYITPEIPLQCLRQSTPGIKVPEMLMKLDEQGMTNQYKVGILYCKAGQTTEEEMYNNQESGPAFEEFLNLIGKKVRLKGFTGYKAQLDNRNDSTGEYSVYTTFHNREIMFHVSTLLPWTPNNKQQLLRKRHIGNDIVTIVFQEPGALPFTPKNIRSHFQHVFIVVQVFNPCTESTYYRVAVSRSKDVPPFGPPIPAASKFGKQKAFANFLLTKIINAENAAHKSEKFSTMATRTRHEYLKDLATNYVTNITLDTGSSKSSFGKFSLSGKKKEKVRPPISPERVARGGLVWNVEVEDYRNSTMIECAMAISSDTLVLIDSSSKESLFSVATKAIIGWTSLSSSIKVFYGGGDCLVLNIPTSDSDDLPEIVRRLEAVTIGCQTQTITLRRNMHGQLGFHVQYEGLVADVEIGGYAWQAGLRHGCRLVEINGMIVATLSHEQMIEILRKPGSVTVVIVSPLPSGKPRKGLQPSNYQYWWSTRSSTSTISSYGGSLTSVGEDHESRDPRNPPRVAPKYHKRSRDENDVDASSSLSSITGSSSTLNDADGRTRTPSYGAAYTVTSVNPMLQDPEKTPTNNQGSQGYSSSYENLNATRPKWGGVPPQYPEPERKATPSSVGVTLKKPTSKGTLYAIASGPQSPGLPTQQPETPLFGSTSQRDRHPRVIVDEHGHVVGGESITVELQLTKNGEIDAKQVYTSDSDREKRNGDKIPYKETTLGAVVTTTSTYTNENDELSEASMTETMEKIEKAFAFKTPNVIDSPRHGSFDRSGNIKRSGRHSPTDKISGQPPEQLHKDNNEKTILAREIKSEMARQLSHEELQVQMILEELQQAEKDLGGTEGRVEVQTVVEMSRGNNGVIRESTPKSKEFDSRLAQRNNVIERLESQRHAISGDRVEGLKIYHAKSRSSPADVSKPQFNPLDRTPSKIVSSQNDLTSGRSRSDQERSSSSKEASEAEQRRQSRRRRSERVMNEQADSLKTPDASRTVKPIVRSERKIKLSTSGGTGLTEEKASTLPRYKPNRKHRHFSRENDETDSTDDDYKPRGRRTDDPKPSGFPKEGDVRRRSLGDSSTQKSPSHSKGTRTAKLKLGTGENSNELVNQTARLLNAAGEAKQEASFNITQDVLQSLTQASDFLKTQLPVKERKESHRRDRESSDRSREREKERKDKSMSKMKSHGRGKSHGPHKFHIPVVPRRHSFDDRILATASSFHDLYWLKRRAGKTSTAGDVVSKPSGGESSFTRESIGREAELEMKLAIVSNALMKEGEEKQRLESDLKRAVKENRKLQENLHMASKQLRKFSEWFFSNRDKSNS